MRRLVDLQAGCIARTGGLRERVEDERLDAAAEGDLVEGERASQKGDGAGALFAAGTGEKHPTTEKDEEETLDDVS